MSLGVVSASAATIDENSAQKKSAGQIFAEDIEELDQESSTGLAEHSKMSIFSDKFLFKTSNGNTYEVSYGNLPAEGEVTTYADSGEGEYPITGPGDFYTYFSYTNFYLNSGNLYARMNYRVTSIISGAPQLKAKSCSLSVSPPQGVTLAGKDFYITTDEPEWVEATDYVTFTENIFGITINLYPTIWAIEDNTPGNTINWGWSV